ncbi:MAG: hypothetical protein QM523_00965 [Candidatus Pacebacteria bacterium]|nr:hypothetical protein [Candidatus Paceibacterota bacterium]
MIEIKRGDRSSLTTLELTTLDGKVIPTARRWLREYPPFAGHAVSTLVHWNDPIVDDRGRPYDGGAL